MRSASFAFLTAFVLALAVGASCGAKAPCDSSSCQGCCDASGMCQTGMTNNSCGRVGSVCTACGAGFSCFSGGCISSGPGNGGGVGGTGGGVGGTGGGVGSSGGGVGGTGGGVGSTGGGTGTGGGSMGTCGPGNCAGCCSGATCLSGTTTTACGWLGDACSTCGSGNICRIDCAPQGTGSTTGVGIGCQSSSNCGTGPSPTCVPEVLPDGGQTGFPGGFCTSGCNSNTDCGPGGICLYDGQTNYCWGGCTGVKQGSSSCRTGYVCDQLQLNDGGLVNSFGYCVPNCNLMPDICAQGLTCQSSGFCQ